MVPVTPSARTAAEHGCPSSVFWEALFHGKFSHRKGQGTPASLCPRSATLLSVTTESLQDTCLGALTWKTWMPIGMGPSVLASRAVGLSDLTCNQTARDLYPSYIPEWTLWVKEKTVGNKGRTLTSNSWHRGQDVA